MTTSSALILKDTTLGVPVIAPSALELKRVALATAKPIKRVTNPEEQSAAVTALKELKSIRSGMETTRRLVKAPVLELGKKIDEAAHNFMEALDGEELRVQGLINHYQREQLRIQREAEQALERERAETARLEELARKKNEQAELAVDPEVQKQAAREAAALEQQAAERRLDEELIGTITVAKPKGLVVKQRLDFKILDPLVFCQAYPDFWHWNAETETLKLKRREILEALNQEDGRGIFHRTQFPEELPDQKGSQLVKPAGMNVFEDTSVHVR